eukprot:jgi/Mesvir1/21886/Mv01955-RA.1
METIRGRSLHLFVLFLVVATAGAHASNLSTEQASGKVIVNRVANASASDGSNYPQHNPFQGHDVSGRLGDSRTPQNLAADLAGQGVASTDEVPSGPTTDSAVGMVAPLPSLSSLPISSAFVTRQGTQFFLRGSPFYFSGWNTYWLMTTAADVGQRPLVRQVMEEGARLGLKVLRTWAFNGTPRRAHLLSSPWQQVHAFEGCRDGADEWNPLQVRPGVYSEKTFVGLDYVLSEAQRLDILVLLSLINWWEDYGGIPQYIAWANQAGAGLSNVDDFYINPLCKRYYQNHVRTVVNRKNVFTGELYREDRNIFGWELMNEPRSYTVPDGSTIKAWAAEMANLVKVLDPNHLVTVGSEGHYGPLTPVRCLTANPGSWACKTGGDFINVHSIPNIDFATHHVYPDTCRVRYSVFRWLGGAPLSQELEFLSRWNAAHIEDAQNILRMPVVGTEFGHRATGPSDTLDERVRVFGAMYRATQESAASGGPAAGALFWLLNAQGTTDWNGYGVTAGQVTNTDITKHSVIMSSIQGPPDNLLINPSMEAEATWPWFSLGEANIGRSTVAKTGNRSLLVSGRWLGTWEGPAQDITQATFPGQRYYLTAWVRVKQAASAPAMLTVKQVTAPGTTDYIRVANATVNDRTWTRLNGEWQAPEGRLTSIYFYVEGVCSSFQGALAAGVVGVPVASRFPDDGGYTMPVSGSHKHTVWVTLSPSGAAPAAASLSFWKEDTPGSWVRQMVVQLAADRQQRTQTSSGRYRWQLLSQSGSLDYKLHMEVPPSPPAGCGELGDCVLYQQFVSAGSSTPSAVFDYVTTLAGSHQHTAWIALPAARQSATLSASLLRSSDAGWLKQVDAVATSGSTAIIRSNQTVSGFFRWTIVAMVGAANFNLFYDKPRAPPQGCGDTGACLLYQSYASSDPGGPRSLAFPRPSGCFVSSTAALHSGWLLLPPALPVATFNLALWKKDLATNMWARQILLTTSSGNTTLVPTVQVLHHCQASCWWLMIVRIQNAIGLNTSMQPLSAFKYYVL